MEDIDVSIIIRARNEDKNVKRCLENIFKQKIDKKFEVIIVDSASTDNTLKIASQFPCKIVKISRDEFTYPRAMNIGVMHSVGKYCVFISMDAYPANEKWLYYLLRWFSDPIVAAVYGRQIPVPTLNPIEETELFTIFPSYRPKNQETASSANCAIIKDLLEKYPFIETHYRLQKSNKLAGEDVLWKMMIESKGYKTIYEPLAVVFHTHPLSIKYIRKRYCDYYNGGYICGYFGTLFLKKSEKNTLFLGKILNIIKPIIKEIRNEVLYLLQHKYYLWIFPYFLFKITMIFRLYYGYYNGKKDFYKYRYSYNI